MGAFNLKKNRMIKWIKGRLAYTVTWCVRYFNVEVVFSEPQMGVSEADSWHSHHDLLNQESALRDFPKF